MWVLFDNEFPVFNLHEHLTTISTVAPVSRNAAYSKRVKYTNRGGLFRWYTCVHSRYRQ